MFRVSKSEEPSRTIVTIDGELSGECIEVVETYCDHKISPGTPVPLL